MDYAAAYPYATHAELEYMRQRDDAALARLQPGAYWEGEDDLTNNACRAFYGLPLLDGEPFTVVLE